MKYFRFLYPAVITFALGAWLAPSGGNGALRRRIVESDAARAAASLATPSPAYTAESSDDAAKRHMGDLLSAMQETTSPLKRGHDTYEALRGLSSVELARLLADADKLPKTHRFDARTAVLQAWFDVDAAAAEIWVHANKDLWEIWAEREPERALAELHTGKLDPSVNPSLANMIYSQAVYAGAKNDRERVAKLITLPADEMRDSALRRELNSWASYDPAGVIAFSEKLPPGNTRRQAVRRALKVLSDRDPMAALKLATAQLPQFQGAGDGEIVSLASLAESASLRDRQAALQWVATLPKDQQSDPNREVARAWAESDPLAAIQWASTHDVPVSDLIASGMVGKPQQTLQWIQTQPDGPEREKMLVAALAAKSPLTAAGTSNADRNQTLGLLAQLSPEGQLAVARSLGAPNGSDDSFVRSKQWIAALPEGPLRAEALSSAGNFFGSGNSRTVLQSHLKDYPEGPMRDTVLQSAIEANGRNFPYSAPDMADTALKISDPQTQQDALNRLFPDWLYREPDKAQAWLSKNASAITPAQIAAWREESQWSTK